MDVQQTVTPSELATALEALGPRLSEWAKALRDVEQMLRASAEARGALAEARTRHEQVQAELADARRSLADLQAEKVQLQADWEATRKRQEAEHREEIHGAVAERERLEREIGRLRERRAQGQQAMTALRAILADIRTRLDSMTD